VRNPHQDHIVALSKGGTQDIDNVVPVCRPCNQSKGSKDLRVWLNLT
jgi:5-methylcytosine-specific restriction endonuclease McrA